MSMQEVKGQRSRSQRLKPNLALSGLQLQFEFTYGYRMMHNACSSIEEVPYWFFKVMAAKFQGQTGQKLLILAQIGRFRTVTPVWIHQWLSNDAQSLKYIGRGALLFFKVICQISRSHG